MTKRTLVICDRCGTEAKPPAIALTTEHAAGELRLIPPHTSPTVYALDLCPSCYRDLCDWLKVSPDHALRFDVR